MNDDPMSKIINEMSSRESDFIEKAIKETIKQGFSYMVVKRETIYKDEKVTVSIKYKGYKDKGALMFIENGYEVYDLEKVREYLKNTFPLKEEI